MTDELREAQAEGIFRMVARSAGGWWLDGTDYDNAHDLAGDLIQVYPTHWMPLPTQPQEETVDPLEHIDREHPHGCDGDW